MHFPCILQLYRELYFQEYLWKCEQKEFNMYSYVVFYCHSYPGTVYVNYHEK
jgi:hypothetical protein